MSEWIGIPEVDLENMKDTVKAFITDPVLQKRLAKYLVQQCFRHSGMEDLHAGKVRGSKAGDYSDVVVRTPFGEIPWCELSRFDNTEIMRTLMAEVVNRTYKFIHELFDEECGAELQIGRASCTERL